MEDTMNTTIESTTSQESETQQGVDGATTLETAPQGEGNAPETTAQGNEDSNIADEETADEPFLEIQYNHEKKGLTREEAISFAQKGMHYEGAYNTLERVATLKGMSVDEFLKGIESAEDENYRTGLVAKFGNDEDTIEKMMELYNINKEKTLQGAADSRRQAAEAEEQSVNARIADEFSRMKADFPELTDYASLPAEVKKAAYNGMSLEYAYLKYGHNEQKKINAAKTSQETAAKKSIGSIDTDKGGAVSDPFLDGLFGR